KSCLLANGVPTDGPYQTNPPSPDDIILSIRIDREGQVRHIRHKEEIDALEYQVLTHEIEPTMKPLEEIIQENVFCLGVFQNPPNTEPHLEPFYTRQTKIINRQVQIRDEQRGGLRSIEKGLRNLWRNIKK
ncbi:hypothetical protein Tco_1087150, partial [Tanacetum coccineum]